MLSPPLFLQVKSRASRLGIRSDTLHLMHEASVDALVDTLIRAAASATASGPFAALFVDSIQAVAVPEGAGSPGSVSQVSGVQLGEPCALCFMFLFVVFLHNTR